MITQKMADEKLSEVDITEITKDVKGVQHLSEESGITQQLYIRAFSESSSNFLSENVNFESVGPVALILLALMSLSCYDTPVFT